MDLGMQFWDFDRYGQGQKVQEKIPHKAVSQGADGAKAIAHAPQFKDIVKNFILALFPQKYLKTA